jgi:aquaporin Z
LYIFAITNIKYKLFTTINQIAMRKYLVEFIGTFFLVSGAILGGGIGASLALMVMIYAGGHISGAHYNPAVTIAVWIRKKIKSDEVAGYFIAQFLGAIVAALLIYYGYENKGGGGECDGFPAGAMKVFLAEVFGTFALAYVILNVATSKGTEGNSFYGLAIGGTVLAMALTVGTYSGGAFNPAVGVGLAVHKSICWGNLWMFFVAPILGGVIAALVFRFVNGDEGDLESIPKEN